MKRWLLIFAFLISSGCQAQKTAPATLLPSTPTPSSQSMIEKILAEPDAFLGQSATLTGVLEAQGQGLNVEFFLRDEAGARLKVSAWAPLEVMHSPQGKPPVRSMAVYIGQSLQLTGVIQRDDTGVFLQTSTAEELK